MTQQQQHQDDGLADQAGAEAYEGLAEAQIAAIEDAFAEHGRLLARLRRDLEDLRAAPSAEPAPDGSGAALEQRLTTIESRLDQQDQALRHMLQRLIGFFGREGSEGF